jgi:hypothetical protein
MVEPKLFMVLIGCKPEGRHTEQHDIFFGIAESMKALIPQIIAFWPEAKGDLHIDGWREVTQVDGLDVQVVERKAAEYPSNHKLFFINLGGYKKGEFEEFHYKMLAAAIEKADAIKEAKKTAFFKHTHFEGANAHIDDKYGIDVDDMYKIEELLTPTILDKYAVVLTEAKEVKTDALHLGYFKLSSL